MAGFPVVIADKFGVPVRAVESGAPAMTIAAYGIPIVLSEWGAPFIVEGLSPPANTQLPEITGTAQVGETLQGSSGEWTGLPPITYAYQWLADGVEISGATESSYTLTEAEIGKVITLRVTATNIAGDTQAVSESTAAVVPEVPVNTDAPAISGTPTVGEVLSASTGTWTNSPTGYAYQWQRNAGSWANISGATASTYTLVEADEGATIRVRVIASNAGGNSAPAHSAATGVIASAPELLPFQLDTGTGNGGDTGYYTTIYGSINQEPLDGFTLVEFATRNTEYFQIAFQGDVTEYVEGWYPVMDPPLNIGGVSSPWAYNSETDITASTWVGGEAFPEPATYQVTWSNA